MSEIVFIENKIRATEPFTTSEIVAEYAGIKHHAIQQLVLKHETDLKEFGVLAFKMRKPIGKKGGAPVKIYCLNEPQTTLLLTYLKNTAPVRAFKKELVRQFYLMRTELMKRQAVRVELKPIRRELTDAIKENPDKGQWSYRLYTDLAYSHALGKTAAQIRRERGAERKTAAVDYMTADELQRIAKVSNQIVVLHDMGMGYEEIKELLTCRHQQ